MHSPKYLFAVISTLLLCSISSGYTLIYKYDASNWFTKMAYQNLPDPTAGTVEYQSLVDAQALGLTRIVEGRVFMGVDNTTYIPATSTAGRKSIWTESVDSFQHGLLIGDFAHVPGSDCGTWPGFWTIRNTPNTPAGEIDIMESFNDNTYAYMTLHTTGQTCSFSPSAGSQEGALNMDGPDGGHITSCIDNPGCSTVTPANSYGDPFNKNGGGVYAVDWTSSFIRMYFFPRNAIPADITTGNPDPTKWGMPTANFDSAQGDCDIDASFPSQTIYFDTTFCGGNAGGKEWTTWGDCSAKTGVATCEEYVRTNPAAYDEAYWLINSVKVYQ